MIDQETITYMKSEKYSIEYNTILEVYIAVDRNGQKVCGKSWSVAAEAIEWSENNYRTLI